MTQKGFTLIELLVVVAIIGIIATLGVVSFQNFTKLSKEGVVIANCKNVINFIESTLHKCSLNPSSTISLKSIGGSDLIENVSCNRTEMPTAQFVNIKIQNHLNNSGFDNVYGIVGGSKGMVQGGGGVCNPQSLGANCNPFDILESNSFQNLSLGRAVVQSQDSGHIAVTCFYDQGSFSAGGNGVITEALKWTTPRIIVDPR
tara:strand:+ start:160 stop:765 length:606 start_codon:yes stop_codon:yes gene_type:complete